jgi:hypothetical protein
MTHAAMTEEQEIAYAEMEPPVNVDVPHVQQEGSVLTCTMGNWDGEPTHYSYQWRVDGVPVGSDSPSLQLSQADIGKTATCVVTAGNAKGIVEAPPSVDVIVEGPPEEGVQSYERS